MLYVNGVIYTLACFTIFLSSTNSQQKMGNPSAIANHSRKVNEACGKDIHCIVHAICAYQTKCRCEVGYTATRDGTSCLMSVGTKCYAPETCSSLPNGECKQETCACKDNYKPDIYNTSNCVPRPTRPGDYCQAYDDCSESMAKAHCINDKCSCYSDHHFVNQTGTCVQVRGLYASCRNDYECFLDTKSPNALKCKNGACECRKPNCNKGSSMQQSMFIVFATLAVGTVNRMLT